MYDQNFGFCRGCGKQILWTRTAAEKSMPCDPQLKAFIPDSGPEIFITPEGETRRGRACETLPETELVPGGRTGPEKLRGYTPHWATCPDWKRFKR